MDKKKIFLILGGVAVIGIGYYLYNKNKKSTQSAGSTETTDGATPNSGTTPTSGTTPASSQSTTAEKLALTTRKEKRKACGRKPKVGKKLKALWQKCVDEGGLASFEGDFDDFENEYIDFSTQVDNQFMFSEFSNNLDLDI